MLCVNSELELRTDREENASLAAARNDYKVRVKNTATKMHKEELNEMALLPEPKP